MKNESFRNSFYNKVGNLKEKYAGVEKVNTKHKLLTTSQPDKTVTKNNMKSTKPRKISMVKF